MKYIIQGNSVMQESTVVTSKQNAVVQMFHCYADGIRASVDKHTIQTSGTEFATLSFSWQRFDVVVGDYVDDPTNASEITVKISGNDYALTPVGGIATLEFDAELPGEYVFETVNTETKNSSIKVVAV